MDGSAQATLAESLASFGRTSFSADCATAQGAARIVMTDTTVALAVADGRGTVLSDGFADVVAVEVPNTAEVNVHVGGRDLTVTFPDVAEAQRFLRVLGVRQDAVRPQARPDRPVVRPSARPSHNTPRTRYAQWTQNTLLTSTLLLALGWLNLIVGAILTIVVAVTGGGASALLWVVLALAGSAVPFCLGSLARVIVYRYELEDAARTG